MKLHSLENNCFIKSWRKFNFKLSIDVHLPAKYFQFKQKFLENIVEIEFDDIYLPNLEILRQYLEDLTNLVKLTFINCRFKDLTIYPDVITLNVTSLHFEGNFLTDITVSYILSLTPKLKVLSTNSINCYDYDKAITRYLKNPNLTTSLRDLTIYNKNGYSSFLCDILPAKHLNLEKINLNTPSRNLPHVEDLEMFLTQHTNLKVLNLLLSVPFLTQLIRICSLNALEHLSFNCLLDINMGNGNFEVFWKLKYLKLNRASSALFKSLTKPSEMETLILESFTDDMNDEITDNLTLLTNLKVFKISVKDSSFEVSLYFKNNLMQSIFKHLLNLRELFLEDCTYYDVRWSFLYL